MSLLNSVSGHGWKDVMVLSVTCFNFFCSGAIYVFGAVANDLKVNQDFSQTEMLALGSSIFLVGGLSCYPCSILSRRFWGPTYVTVALLQVFGYLLLGLVFHGAIDGGFAVMLVGFALIGMGTLGTFSLVYKSTIVVLWKNSAFASAVSMSFYGIGNVIWPVVYNYIVDQKLDQIFFIIGVCVAISSILILMTNLYPMIFPELSNVQEPLLGSSHVTSVLPVSSYSSLQVLKTALTSPSFWGGVLIYFCMFGSTVNMMNMGESMLTSVDDKCTTNNLITFAGCAQTLSRVLIIVLVALKVGTPRVSNFIVWSFINVVIQVVINLVASTHGMSCASVWVYVCGAAFSYGATWTLFFTFIFEICPSSIQTQEAFGDIVGLCTATSPAFGPLIYTVVSGYMYDHEGVHTHDNGVQCFGQHCFHNIFVVGSVTLGLAALIHAALLVVDVQSKRRHNM